MPIGERFPACLVHPTHFLRAVSRKGMTALRTIGCRNGVMSALPAYPPMPAWRAGILDRLDRRAAEFRRVPSLGGTALGSDRHATATSTQIEAIGSVGPRIRIGGSGSKAKRIAMAFTTGCERPGR